MSLKFLFKSPTLGLGELVDESNKLLYSLQWDGVVVAGTDATNAPVALEAGEAEFSGLFQESLLGLINVTTLRTPG